MRRRASVVIRDFGAAGPQRFASRPFDMSQFDAAFCYFRSPHGPSGVNDETLFKFQGSDDPSASLWYDLGDGSYACPPDTEANGGAVCVAMGILHSGTASTPEKGRTPMKYTPGLIRVIVVSGAELWDLDTEITVEGFRFR